MAINPNALYPAKTVAPDANYPYGSAQNVTVPGDGTGTPWEQAIPNDIFGIFQRLLSEANIVPSGNADTIVASDYFDSLVKIFARTQVYNDTGAADAYVIGTASGADSPPYADGLVVKFVAAVTNTGASTIRIGALGIVGLTLPGGGALSAGMVTAGQYIEAVYRSTGTRFEMISPAIPSGLISIWSGAIAVIPSGWTLCDGTAGTPDLTDRFVIHADADAAGTHDVGDTINGVGASDGYTLLEADIPAHDHDFPTYDTDSGAANTARAGSNIAVGTEQVTQTGGGGSHAHAITDYKPKSYALAYIMKV